MSTQNNLFQAIGGEIFDHNGYRTHTFKQSGEFKVIAGSNQLEVFVLAGGGSGGPEETDGGQGGGAIEKKTPGMIREGSYKVIVGAGGSSGQPGEDSLIFGIRAIGGRSGVTEKGVVHWLGGSDGSVFVNTFLDSPVSYGGTGGINAPNSKEAKFSGQFINGGGGGHGNFGPGFDGLVIVRYTIIPQS